MVIDAATAMINRLMVNFFNCFLRGVSHQFSMIDEIIIEFTG